VVTGDEQLEPITAATEIRQWKKRTYKALDYLMDTVKMRAVTTAAEVWEILKNTYEGQTRTHLISLHANLVHLKYDDRKDRSLADHISKFEGHWLKLAQATQTGHNVKGSLAEGIYPFTTSDAWKAALLLFTPPRIQPYLNIADNIPSKDGKFPPTQV